MTVQVFLDTLLLSWHDPHEMAASFPATMWFWLGFGFLQVTSGYDSTFVAQYWGAGRQERVGPAVWQGIHFSILAGLAFLLFIPIAPWLISLGGHSAELQALEVIYFRCLCWAALPMLIMSAVNGFFSGRGQTWVVLLIEAVGTLVNICLALILIFGRLGFPEMGIAGAGWSTVAGASTSALVALALFFQPTYATHFQTRRGWRLDLPLFTRLLKYGGPAGAQVFLDVLVFHMFVQLVGRLGDAATGATTLAGRMNMISFLPMMGLGQAVAILVAQRLGADRPDLAEKSAFTGLKWNFAYMCLVAAVYLLFPETLVGLFQSDSDPSHFAAIASLVPTLLTCVALYSVADSVNVTFAFALRGAGDTRFVSVITFLLAWPLMVLPTWAIVHFEASLYWAWGFATAYVFAMATCFWLRFRSGVWKSMRVIAAAPND